jgi:hypothetical protein
MNTHAFAPSVVSYAPPPLVVVVVVVVVVAV